MRKASIICGCGTIAETSSARTVPTDDTELTVVCCSAPFTHTHTHCPIFTSPVTPPIGHASFCALLCTYATYTIVVELFLYIVFILFISFFISLSSYRCRRCCCCCCFLSFWMKIHFAYNFVAFSAWRGNCSKCRLILCYLFPLETVF